MNHKQKRLDIALKRGTEDIIGEEALAKVEIKECGEPLLSIDKVIPSAIIRMSEVRASYAGGQVLFARETCCKMLEIVSSSFSSKFNLVIFDAFRPLEYQRMRFNNLFLEYQRKYQNKTEKEIRAIVFEYIFPPSEDPQTPPAHITGGAIDLSLADLDGNPLDMGCLYGQFDSTTFSNSTEISEIQKNNRYTLMKRMIDVGFCNYPGEWWHFMYGDREYAAYEGHSHAIYGRAKLA